MINKNQARVRRAKKSRAKMRELRKIRLVVYRSSRHIYCQIIDVDGHVICSASTLDKQVKTENTGMYSGNMAAARIVGNLISERAHAAGVLKVAFDRSGYLYHGRIKALAEAAREKLDF